MSAVRTAVDAWERARAAASDVDLGWAEADLADGWALRGDALALIMALVAELRPRHVLELGSGLSTRALARATAGLDPPCAISSIDHDPVFSARAAEGVAGDGFAGVVRFQVAPLVARTFRGRGPMHPTYLLDPDQLATTAPVDLALIDGPPSMLGGRAGTLYQLLDLCRPGTTVLLDDADRPEERQAVAGWAERLGDAIDVTFLSGFERGLARIVVAANW